jgi:hypothetical protein
LHASSQDQINSSNSFQDEPGISHINANIHKNIGASAKTEIADTTASIKAKWCFHITSTQEKVARLEPASLTTYWTTSKEIQN